MRTQASREATKIGRLLVPCTRTNAGFRIEVKPSIQDQVQLFSPAGHPTQFSESDKWKRSVQDPGSALVQSNPAKGLSCSVEKAEKQTWQRRTAISLSYSYIYFIGRLQLFGPSPQTSTTSFLFACAATPSSWPGRPQTGETITS